jgi:hypothetical protein
MENTGKFDKGMYQLQEFVGCTECANADPKALGIMGAEFCPKGLTDIGPCSLRCRAAKEIHAKSSLRITLERLTRQAAVLALAVFFMAGCGKNPAGPSDQPTAKPSVAATATSVATAAPTSAPTAAPTPDPTATPTTESTPAPTATATTVPTTKHLKYYLASGCHADVYLYLPGMSAPVTVWPGTPQIFETDVPITQSIPAASWSFYGPVSPFDYTTTIWVDGCVYSDVTRNF